MDTWIKCNILWLFLRGYEEFSQLSKGGQWLENSFDSYLLEKTFYMVFTLKSHYMHSDSFLKGKRNIFTIGKYETFQNAQNRFNHVLFWWTLQSFRARGRSVIQVAGNWSFAKRKQLSGEGAYRRQGVQGLMLLTSLPVLCVWGWSCYWEDK